MFDSYFTTPYFNLKDGWLVWPKLPSLMNRNEESREGKLKGRES